MHRRGGYFGNLPEFERRGGWDERERVSVDNAG